MESIRYKENEFAELERIQNDLLKLFESYRKEKEAIQNSQRAILNILDDYVAEKQNLENHQKAILNILYDNEAAKQNAEKAQNALMNILDDYNKEKITLADSQKALLNILDDYQIEKKTVKQTNEELILSNKELESFSYSVSHDLRAPLRAIHGYSEMLSEEYGTKLDDEGKRILQNIKDNAVKMGVLIDELLTFSRLGRKEIQKTEIDMNEVIKSVMIEINKSITHKAKIKKGKLHNLRADHGLLCQVMFNLISNAIKYSSKQENPLVEISSEENDSEIVYTVKDNGVGFDMQFADKLFGVFQRLHSEEEFEGTGVGLAIVKKIIARHGGKVWAKGKLNEGAVFYFSLTKN